MSNPTSANIVQLPRQNDDSDIRPLLPDGQYHVGFDYYETKYYFGKSPKVVMHFHIIDQGAWFGIPLTRWYSVERIGKPRKGGSFKAKGQTSILLIEYFRCFPGQPTPKRLDRLPMNEWNKNGYLAKVVSVKENGKQVKLPEQLRYSKIETLLGVCNDF